MFFFHFKKNKIRKKNFDIELISKKKIFYIKLTQKFLLKNFLRIRKNIKKRSKTVLFFSQIKTTDKNILKNQKFSEKHLDEIKNFRFLFFINKTSMFFFNGFFKHRFRNFIKFHKKVFTVFPNL
ncbi:hypothetical protein HAN_3g447 (nucleomorph) [Hemiselmis andersenii]|uniref:Uncharacterized protein n=1 Tax=Hemiselmis andersenii TaxID=464988 RepID=A9BL66_HEMAN|nr:hypothetical protein HAN_3g447 [Hemiselmis andersenii]ABW98249.1 hypothetical protein HAN_3g447 [Hemiselmis andersenii]